MSTNHAPSSPTWPSPPTSRSPFRRRPPPRGSAGGVGYGNRRGDVTHADHEHLGLAALGVVIVPGAVRRLAGALAASGISGIVVGNCVVFAAPPPPPHRGSAGGVGARRHRRRRLRRERRPGDRRIVEALAASGRRIVEATDSHARGGRIEDAADAAAPNTTMTRFMTRRRSF